MIAQPTSTASNPPMATGLHVIVADDVPEIRELIGMCLQEAGHSVTYASNGREAVRAALGAPCDLMITDILMPDGDGLDVIVALKRANPGIRILGISGGGKYMTGPDALRLAQAIGADGMLLKPFTRTQLFTAIERVVQPARR